MTNILKHRSGKPIVFNNKSFLDQFDTLKEIENINKELFKEIEFLCHKFIHANQKLIIDQTFTAEVLLEFAKILFALDGHIGSKMRYILERSQSIKWVMYQGFDLVRFRNHKFFALEPLPFLGTKIAYLKLMIKYLKQLGFDFLKNKYFKEEIEFYVCTLPSLTSHTFLFKYHIKSMDEMKIRANNILEKFWANKPQKDINFTGKSDFREGIIQILDKKYPSAKEEVLQWLDNIINKHETDEEFLRALKTKRPEDPERCLEESFQFRARFLADKDIKLGEGEFLYFYLASKLSFDCTENFHAKFERRAATLMYTCQLYIDIIHHVYFDIDPENEDEKNYIKELLNSEKTANLIRSKIAQFKVCGTVSSYAEVARSVDVEMIILYSEFLSQFIKNLNEDLKKWEEEKNKIEQDLLEEKITVEQAEEKQEALDEKAVRTSYLIQRLVVKLSEEFLDSIDENELKNLEATLERAEEKGLLARNKVGQNGVKREGDLVRVKVKGDSKSQYCGYKTESNEYVLSEKVSAKQIHSGAKQRRELIKNLISKKYKQVGSSVDGFEEGEDKEDVQSEKLKGKYVDEKKKKRADAFKNTFESVTC